MITKEKGYSLNVLVITIAVMLILTSTAVVTLRSLTKDRDISSFMSDLQEVEAFIDQAVVITTETVEDQKIKLSIAK